VTRRVLVGRLDGAGDVLLAGPAVRAVAAGGTGDTGGTEVTLLCGPEGAPAGRLLPGVRRVLTWASPWAVNPPPPVEKASLARVVERLGEHRFDEAVVLTSFHQSPLPTALLLRLAGVARITGASVDYPGALLDVRLRPGEGPGDDLSENLPEPERALRIVAAAGYALPPGDDGALAVRRPPCVDALLGPLVTGSERPFVVLHPGAAVPARRWPAGHYRRTAEMLERIGLPVVVTGSTDEVALTAGVARHPRRDLGGRTDLARLAGVLSRAAAVVVGNTGAAHLAAAVGTPIVSLFAPVVPAARWRPYRVPHVLLGDQDAPCRDTRARDCPVDGHPCLAGVSPPEVVGAVLRLVRARRPPRPVTPAVLRQPAAAVAAAPEGTP